MKGGTLMKRKIKTVYQDTLLTTLHVARVAHFQYCNTARKRIVFSLLVIVNLYAVSYFALVPDYWVRFIFFFVCNAMCWALFSIVLYINCFISSSKLQELIDRVNTEIPEEPTSWSDLTQHHERQGVFNGLII